MTNVTPGRWLCSVFDVDCHHGNIVVQLLSFRARRPKRQLPKQPLEQLIGRSVSLGREKLVEALGAKLYLSGVRSLRDPIGIEQAPVSRGKRDFDRTVGCEIKPAQEQPVLLDSPDTS